MSDEWKRVLDEREGLDYYVLEVGDPDDPVFHVEVEHCEDEVEDGGENWGWSLYNSVDGGLIDGSVDYQTKQDAMSDGEEALAKVIEPLVAWFNDKYGTDNYAIQAEQIE